MPATLSDIKRSFSDRPPLIDHLYANEVPDDSKDRLYHPPLKCRSVFISDTHFGTSSNCTNTLVEFFGHVEPEFLTLDGDIVDFWNLGKRIVSDRQIFNRYETTAIQKIFRFDRHGTKVPVIGGNHDQMFRNFARLGIRLGNNIIFIKEGIHKTADGKHFLIRHGDEYDSITSNFQAMSILATQLYDRLSQASIAVDKLRMKNKSFDAFLRKFGLDSEWSFSHAIKNMSDRATFTNAHESAMIQDIFHRNAEIFARRQQQPVGRKEPYIDGLIHGHFHNASETHYPSPIDRYTGLPNGPKHIVRYDLGHWTGRPSDNAITSSDAWRDRLDRPTCTGLIEHLDGKMQMIEFRQGIRSLPVVPQFKNGSSSRPLELSGAV